LLGVLQEHVGEIAPRDCCELRSDDCAVIHDA
jgi:hypothetical protein